MLPEISDTGFEIVWLNWVTWQNSLASGECPFYVSLCVFSER